MSIDRGCVKAMVNLGLYYSKVHNHDEMEKYYQMAIAQGDPDAMYNLGLFYETRILEISLQYYRSAAEKGHSEAIKKIAVLNVGNII